LKLALFIKGKDINQSYDEYMEIHTLASRNTGYKLSTEQKSYFIFAFVRNPLDRLVSCYEDKVKSTKQHHGKYYFDTNYNKIFINTFFGDKFRQDMSFGEFIKLVCKIPDLFADGHFKSQVSIV
jgi:hypothetical protein